MYGWAIVLFLSPGLLPGSRNRKQRHAAHIEQVARTEPLKNYSLKPGHVRPPMLDHGYFILLQSNVWPCRAGRCEPGHILADLFSGRGGDPFCSSHRNPTLPIDADGRVGSRAHRPPAFLKSCSSSTGGQADAPPQGAGFRNRQDARGADHRSLDRSGSARHQFGEMASHGRGRPNWRQYEGAMRI
jgi:hypothetical protein